MAHAISEKRKSLRKQLSALRVDDKPEWALSHQTIEPARSIEYSGFGSAKKYGNNNFDFKYRYGTVAKKGGSSMDALPIFQLESRNLFPSRVDPSFSHGFNSHLDKPFGDNGSLLNSRGSLTTSYDSPKTTRAFIDSSRNMGSAISIVSRTPSRVKFEFHDPLHKIDEKKYRSYYLSQYKKKTSSPKIELSGTFPKPVLGPKSQSQLRKLQEPETQTKKGHMDSNLESIKTDDVFDKTQTQFATKSQKKKPLSCVNGLEETSDRLRSCKVPSKESSLEDDWDQTKVRNFYSAKRYARNLNSQYSHSMLTSIPEESKKDKAKLKDSDYYIGPLLRAFDQEEKTDYFSKIRLSHFEETLKQFRQYQKIVQSSLKANISRPMHLADSLGPSHLKQYLILDLDETLVYCSKHKMNVGAVQVELPIPPFKVC